MKAWHSNTCSLSVSFCTVATQTPTPLVSFFQVMLARSTAAAQDLLGQDFRGILNSDRYSAYNWVD
ncbi:MAG: transposase, partial [Waterburya sp.]